VDVKARRAAPFATTLRARDCCLGRSCAGFAVFRPHQPL